MQAWSLGAGNTAETGSMQVPNMMFSDFCSPEKARALVCYYFFYLNFILFIHSFIKTKKLYSIKIKNTSHKGYESKQREEKTYE